VVLFSFDLMVFPGSVELRFQKQGKDASGAGENLKFTSRKADFPHFLLAS